MTTSSLKYLAQVFGILIITEHPIIPIMCPECSSLAPRSVFHFIDFSLNLPYGAAAGFKKNEK